MKANGPIIIATDGSPSAQLAVAVGLQLAREGNSEVVFIHDSPEVSDQLFEQDPKVRQVPDEIAEADPVLGQAFGQAKTLGIPARLEVLGERGTRNLAAAIVGAAAGLEAKLIVVGSRGRSPLTEALLGSVSREVAATSSIPVVIVHVPPVFET